jgi:hypothetical protein
MPMRWPPRSTAAAKQEAKLAALQAVIDEGDSCDPADDIDGDTALGLLPMSEMDTPALTAKVSAMSQEEASARIQEIVYGGPMNDETRLELAKLWGGPNVTVSLANHHRE